MARFEFRLPDIGEGIAEAEIVAWHVKVGDMVEEDAQLADLMTDKATVEMESPVGGKVLKLAGEVGEQIAIGSVLVVIETDAGSVGGTQQDGQETGAKGERTDTIAFTDGLVEPTEGQAEANPSSGETNSSFVPSEVEGRFAQPDPRPSTTLGTSEGEDKIKAQVLASPAVRQRARDLGIDLAEVKTASDRIRHADLDAYLLYNGGAVSQAPQAQRQDEVVKVAGLRRRIADNMQEAKRRIPHFTLVEEMDVTALEQTRAMMNADRGGDPKLTLLPFLITAMCRALADHPQLNARYDDDAQIVTRSGAVHMGIATQTPNGLMVPVIRDAGRRGVWDIAGEILRLAEAARSGKAAREELSGSTITISSLGPMGGIASTPVINRPEVAIVAVNKVEEKPVVAEGRVAIAKRMNLSLSCDHRVVDGWDAATFLQAVKALVENPLKLLSLR